MKKVPKHYKNVNRNPEMNKNSQTVYFEDEDECVSLVQIGDKIKVVSPQVISKIQQRAVNTLIQYLQKQYRIHNKDMNTSGSL
jgi:cation transport ATPase|tara:strand:+ start:484 stop:732 length:249 start_codon:yes stop_codon:yes gene_type:complete